MPLLARGQHQQANFDNNNTKKMISNPLSNPSLQAGPAPPSIRLISATPSASGLSSEASTSFNRSLEDSWATMPSLPTALAPKASSSSLAPRKKLVPKKSKLGILGGLTGATASSSGAPANKDFSDIARRIGAPPSSASARGGFEIYVDPTVDPDFGEILVVKKKKSRVALDGMSWGALGEVTNVPKANTNVPLGGGGAPNNNLLKVKEEEKDKKWWSIGRGRKDSKDKKENNKMSVNAKPVEFIYKPEERAKTPEPFKHAHSQDSRGRFNSLDSGMLLGSSSSKKPTSSPNPSPHPSISASSALPPTMGRSVSQNAALTLGSKTRQEEGAQRERAQSTNPLMYSRSQTPTMGGLLAVPTIVPMAVDDDEESGGNGASANAPGGSIALRAIRSMRSLARMGSWAQLKNPTTTTTSAMSVAEEMERRMDVDERIRGEAKEGGEAKDGKKKTKSKGKKENREEDGEGKKGTKKTKSDKASVKGKSKDDKEKKKEKKSKEKEKERAATTRISTSSFEIGHLTASPSPPKPAKDLGTKKHSILGLGLPSTMRLPNLRGGSTASSINFNLLSANGGKQEPQPGSASLKTNPNNLVSSSTNANANPNRLVATPNGGYATVSSLSALGALSASALSAASAIPDPGRLSVDSARAFASNPLLSSNANSGGISGRGRAGSVASAASASSNASSLRPVSVSSAGSRLSSVSATSSRLSAGSIAGGGNRLSGGSGMSGASIRWDEEGLETVKELRRREREAAALAATAPNADDREGRSTRRTSRESRRSSSGRRRTPLASIFPNEVGSYGIGVAMLEGVDESSSSHDHEHAMDVDATEGVSTQVITSADGIQPFISRPLRRSVDSGSTSSHSNSNSSSAGSVYSSLSGGSRLSVDSRLSIRSRRRSGSSSVNVGVGGYRGPYPILTIEEATADGHGSVGGESLYEYYDHSEQYAGMKLGEDRRLSGEGERYEEGYSVNSSFGEESMEVGVIVQGGRRVSVKQMVEEETGRLSQKDVADAAERKEEKMDVDEEEEAEANTSGVTVTPVKKARRRPMSEQLLGKARPKPVYDDDEAFRSILNAATNDLALLINNLDLQATPATPDMTPLKPSPLSSPFALGLGLGVAQALGRSKSTPPTPDSHFKSDTTPLAVEASTSAGLSQASGKKAPLVPESPLSKTLRGSMGSISSLRPYAQSRGYATGMNRQDSMSSIRGVATNMATMASTAPLTLRGKTSASKTPAPEVAPEAKVKTQTQAQSQLVGQPIAPWSTLLSPVKEKGKSTKTETKVDSPALTSSASSSSMTFRPGHKRTMTPAPEPEPELVFQPLKPARGARGAVHASPPFLALASKASNNNFATIRPVRSKVDLALNLNVDLAARKRVFEPVLDGKERDRDEPLSSHTFGPRSARSSTSASARNSKGSMTIDELSFLGGGGSGSLTPVFKRISEVEKKRASGASLVPVPADYRGASRSSASPTPAPGLGDSYTDSFTAPLARSAKRVLGMSGTMGGSDISCYRPSSEPDASDPDSDVPEELKFILATNSARSSVVENIGPAPKEELPVPGGAGVKRMGSTLDVELSTSAKRKSMSPSPSLSTRSGPPQLSLPILRTSFVSSNGSDIDMELTSPTTSSDNENEDNTKRSFDFTGELAKLNESGASDRRSFVEQLENAFKTPAKVDLRYDFGRLRLEVPPVPEMPASLRMAVGDSDVSGSAEGSGESSKVEDSIERMDEVVDVDESEDRTESMLAGGSESNIVDIKMPSMVDSSSMDVEVARGVSKSSSIDLFSVSRIVDASEPSFLPYATDSEMADSSKQDESANRPSDGELDRSFRFGGLPKNGSSLSLAISLNSQSDKAPLTLSDIIPNPEQAKSISEGSMVSEELDDDVLQSIYAKLLEKDPAPRARVNSDSSLRPENKRISIYKATSRPASGISFAGLESFDEVRRNFEFSGERSYYPPAADTSRRSAPHRHNESVFSIASISSYGHVINNGVSDPFDYGEHMPSLRERPSSEDMSSIMSLTVDDTFAFMRDRPRRRVESDASSFYFQPTAIRGTHRRRESNMSVVSQAGPPNAFYNRSFGQHRRNDSSASTSSVAMSYIKHGANGGISAWARHHKKDMSVDSVMSDFSGMHLGRPGLGDKMFGADMTMDHGPLTSISASPPESASASQSHFGLDTRHSYDYDSILDAEEQRTSMEDSLFEKTGQRLSMSSGDSVFGDDESHSYQAGLFPPGHCRPLSFLSDHGTSQEGDTMISMLGGGHGHVRRGSIEASPCVRIEKRIEKRKHAAVVEGKRSKHDHYESPNKARIVEKPSIASTSSFQFGGDRMIKAQRGLLERQSLEENCLIADGEDLSGYCPVPVFTRPGPAGRSRSSTCTSSSGGDTPPLSASDGSSISGGSQSSIDLSQINIALSNATHPLSTVARNRARTRARGAGHRRRQSKAISRSSVYETIEEEINFAPSPAHTALAGASPTTRQDIFIVDADTASIHSRSEDSTAMYDDEKGITALRKFYALRDEAHHTVSESKKLWIDTPFSIYAIQSFEPPQHPTGMQALLQHSVQTYGPLPSELRPHRVRSRTSSRATPYPPTGISKTSPSPEVKKQSNGPALRQVNLNPNIVSAVPSIEAFKPFSPLIVDVDRPKKNSSGLPNEARPRVGSNARRTALGWSKRSTGKSSTGQKENAAKKENVAQKENVVANGTIMTPGDTLRLNRPRPKGRTPGGRTPATQTRAIRI